MPTVTVCDDPEVATVLSGHGAQVVLCGPPAAMADAVAALRDAGGRVAALIGDLADAEAESAALAMAAELFGGQPVIVRTASDAIELTAGAAPDEERSGRFEPHPKP